MADQVTLPLFPLPLVVFPGEPLPLHIFEERYKALITWCLEGERLGEQRRFGVSKVTDEGLAAVGCAVVIEQVRQRYPDGRYDIITVGQQRYELLSAVRERVWPEGEIRWFDDDPDDTDQTLIDRTVALHTRLIELVRGEPPRYSYAGLRDLAFVLGHEAGLDVGERQRLLELRTERARLAALVTYYEGILPRLAEREDVARRIRSNGHIPRGLA